MLATRSTLSKSWSDAFHATRLTRTWQKNKAWLRGKFNWIYRRWYSITFSCLSCEYNPPSQLVVWDLSFTYRQAYLNQYHTMAVLFGINIWSDGVQLWNALESWLADKIKNDNNNSLKNVYLFYSANKLSLLSLMEVRTSADQTKQQTLWFKRGQ